jgi:hypothetical protein
MPRRFITEIFFADDLGVGSLNHITLVESISWKWNQFWKRTIPGSIGGLIFGLIGWTFTITSLPEFKFKFPELSRKPLKVLILSLILSLHLSLIFGLVSGLVGGFTDRVMVDKASPNQGSSCRGKNLLLYSSLLG